jgi:plasmid stabilization system protein ParE
VASIELAPEVAEDFERILDHLATYQVENPGQRIGEIIAALDVLELNPLIGRPAINGKRELVIGRRSRGYLALYRYVPEMDIVFVLAIRSQVTLRDLKHSRKCNSEELPSFSGRDHAMRKADRIYKLGGSSSHVQQDAKEVADAATQHEQVPNAVVVPGLVVQVEVNPRAVNESAQPQPDQPASRHGFHQRLDGNQYHPAHQYIEDHRQAPRMAAQGQFLGNAEQRQPPAQAE